MQHIKALVAVDATNGKKRIDYDYDLVSGKVNMVSYQHNKGDQFFYKYQYDADNRVIRSLSSRDKLIWIEDGSYNYYLHGPLARMELGQYKVQGIDYAYTLQGWLKGINADKLDVSKEMGNDGYSGSAYSRVSRDVFGFKLGYFNNDYSPIGGMDASAFSQHNYTAPSTLENTGNQLFNGNISYTTLALSKINNGATTGYSYGYDQLNRLVEMRQHSVSGSAWNNSSIISAYRESIAYDANGNILKYLRKGSADTPDMDSFNYKYNRDINGKIVNNKLNHVRDAVGSNNYTVDIDNQSVNNYLYDNIGNLKKDVAEGIDAIDWTVYGKINKIDKGSGSDLLFGYDAGGNRTMKKVFGISDTSTYYVRDAQGNVMALYSKKGTDDLRWNEQHLYGSSRLGMWNWDTIVPATAPIVQNDGQPIYDSLMMGSRVYEVTNHLGNTNATISDKKIGNDSSGVVNYYIAEVLSQTDFYPGGMDMPQRSYTSGNPYRYGAANGQEKSTEINGSSYTAEFWQYDSRLVRRWNVDPVLKVGESPYLCFSGNPIFYADPLGNTASGPTDWIKKKNSDGTTSYKWDDKAKNQGTTPAGYKYVGATGRYANNDYSNVDLYANGDWLRSSGVTAESGSKGSATPTQEAPSAASSAPLNIKPGPQATVGPVGYTFNNDFERGMIKDNIATQASVMAVGGVTSTIATKLFLNSAVQLSVNGKNADFADVGINSFSPYNYANLYGTAAVDWKPLSGNLTPQVVGINKSWQKAALDLGLNHVFYGVGKFNEAVAPNLSSTQKLVVGTVNSVNKAVVKKAFGEGMFQAAPSNNVSESTKAPPLYNPGLKQ